MQFMKKIPLHDVHVSLQAKMVEYAGFEMPVRYGSDKEEHLTVRKGVGVFDVSHMGEFIVSGTKALSLLQLVTSNDVSKLTVGQAQYSYLPNDKGGIIDDLIVYRLDVEQYMLVVNAANIEKDWNWISKQNTTGAQLRNVSDEFCLFAVQGPDAKSVVQELTPTNLSDIPFYHFVSSSIAQVEGVIISNTGYTGAGGFELYVPNKQAAKVWEALFETGNKYQIKPIGLAARDTLRLEKGYCLYGNDIDDSTSPIEAGLGWVTKFSKPFINSEALREQKESGVGQRLVGIEMVDKGIPRKGYLIYDSEGKEIGKMTSGTISPSLSKGIGMGYVQTGNHHPGTVLAVQVRNKSLEAKVVKTPFI